jgi:DNA polymerase II small subunit/DNA polymerase delta subunit B
MAYMFYPGDIVIHQKKHSRYKIIGMVTDCDDDTVKYHYADIETGKEFTRSVAKMEDGRFKKNLVG